MVSTFTPNIQLNEPARGDDVGTWDVPVNANMTLLDLVTGGTATVGLGSGNVTLSAAQFQSNTIIFNSTLIQNTVVTFPTSFTKPYNILHNCTGSSAFTITLQTTATASTFVAIPPGTMCSILNNNNNITFAQLDGPIGTYWDYAGSSVPNWVGACATPPYLNCDGTTFSSATYPQLAVVFGGTTLPDSRGRGRMALNQGTARVNSSNSFVDGNTRGAAGGNEFMTAHTHTISDPGHNHTISNGTFGAPLSVFGGGGTAGFSGAGANASGGLFAAGTGITLNSAVTGITAQTAGAGGSQNMQPTYVGGITMIRAG